MNSKSNSAVKIIDIRKAEDYKKGHIPGAVNIQNNNNIEEMISIDNLVIIYCYNGKGSTQVCENLREKGYKVVSLEGGWLNGWLPYINSDGG